MGCGSSFLDIEEGSKSPILIYQFSGNHLEDGEGLDVWMRFRGNASGTTELRIPARFLGQNNLSQAISAIKLLSDEVKLESRPQTLRITHRPNEIITLTYRLKQDWSGRLESSVFGRPIVNKSQAVFAGGAGLIRPASTPDNVAESYTVRARWDGLEGEEQEFQATLHELDDSLFVGGKLRRRGMVYWVAPIQLQARQVEDVVYKGWEWLKDFWKTEAGLPRTLVIVPTDQTCCDARAVHLRESILIYVSRAVQSVEQLQGFFERELFKSVVGGEGERDWAWWNEGLASFYARIYRLRSGELTFQDYVKEINVLIAQYYRSSVKKITNATLAQTYSKDPSVRALATQRGELLALQWFLATKKRTDFTLDDALRAMRESMLSKGTDLNFENLQRVLRPYLGDHVQQELRDKIVRGTVQAPDKGAMGPCVELVNKKVQSFDLGFDHGRYETPDEVRGVRPGSTAFQAGIRNGQKILKRQFQWGSSDHLAEFLVSGKTERWIRYYPQGAIQVLPQYVVQEDQFKKDPGECAGWFSAR